MCCLFVQPLSCAMFSKYSTCQANIIWTSENMQNETEKHVSCILMSVCVDRSSRPVWSIHKQQGKNFICDLSGKTTLIYGHHTPTPFTATSGGPHKEKFEFQTCLMRYLGRQQRRYCNSQLCNEPKEGMLNLPDLLSPFYYIII